MAQSFSEGSVFNYTTTTGGSPVVANGDLLVVGQRVGVALNSATTGQVIAVALDGVFEVASFATGTLTAGDAAYYSLTSGVKAAVRVKASSTGYLATGANIKYSRTIGTIWETKGATAGRTKIKIKLIGGPMAYA
jgi:predicted RecA/RadA family phage recombinase